MILVYVYGPVSVVCLIVFVNCLLKNELAICFAVFVLNVIVFFVSFLFSNYHQ